MNVLGLWEVTGAATARRRDDELASLRAGAVAGRRTAEGRAASTADGGSGDGPPAVARELIALADRLVDLTGRSAPTDLDQAVAALQWLTVRVSGLLAMCEVAPITDDGVLDFMRHEVVADRPAPTEALVDHIAGTVRPGYRWRHDLLRPQQVVAYIAAEDNT